jgi:hypothetical protein
VFNTALGYETGALVGSSDEKDQELKVLQDPYPGGWGAYMTSTTLKRYNSK